MSQYSVLLVEDDEPTRLRFEKAIRAHEKLTLIDAVGTCEAARAALDKTIPHALLTDLGLPDGSGIELIKEIYNRGYSTEVLVFTVFRDEQHVISAIEAGATGYLLKDKDVEHVGDAIVDMMQGDAPISASIARHLLRRFQTVPVETQTQKNIDIPQLSTREQEVLEFIAKGFNVPEIAELLGISHHTVATHVKHIYRKLAVKSRNEAIFEAAKMGLVSF